MHPLTTIEEVIKLWTVVAFCLTSKHIMRPGRRADGRSVNGRHPDAGFVNFEQVSYERVEVDIGVGKVKEGQLLPVPISGVSGIQ